MQNSSWQNNENFELSDPQKETSVSELHQNRVSNLLTENWWVEFLQNFCRYSMGNTLKYLLISFNVPVPFQLISSLLIRSNE